MNADKASDPRDDAQNRFYMAPDHLGHWVVQDQSCGRSGYFITQEAARQFILSENGRRPDLIVELSQASALRFRQSAFHEGEAPEPKRKAT